MNKIMLVALLLSNFEIIFSAGTSASVSTSSSDTPLSILMTSSIVLSSLLGIVATGTAIVSIYSGYGFSDKTTVKNAQKLSKQLVDIQKNLKKEKLDLDTAAQKYNDIALSLENLNKNFQLAAEEKVKQQKELSKALANAKKTFDKKQKTYQDIVDKGQLISAELDNIEKKIGGNLKNNFITQEAQKAVMDAAVEIMGTTSFTTLTPEQISAIENAAVKNINANKQGILKRWKNKWSQLFSRNKKVNVSKVAKNVMDVAA